MKEISNERLIIRDLIEIIELQGRLIKIMANESPLSKESLFDACAQLVWALSLEIDHRLRAQEENKSLGDALFGVSLDTRMVLQDFVEKRDNISKAIWKIRLDNDDENEEMGF